MPGPSELTKDVDIDIGALFSNIWKRKFLIIILSLLSGVAIFLVMSSIAPRYQATSQLIIEQRESQFTRVQQNNNNTISDFDTAAVLSQVQIILSDDIALSTIKRLDLASKPEFGSPKKSSALSDLLILFGIKKNPLDISPEERVLKAFKKRVKAYSLNKSRVIEIMFWANDRELAKEITNTIAAEYLNLQRKSKLETDSNATKFLEPEIAALRKKVTAAEGKVAQYRTNSDILLGTNNALLSTQQLSELSTELSRTRGLRIAAQAKVESVRSNLGNGASLEAIPEVVASPLIQRLRERQVGLRAQISELSTTLLPAHPRLKALKSQIRDFENQIRREARGILRSLENNVNALKNQENALVGNLTRLKSEVARAGEAEVQMRALEREAVSERALLQTYTTKFREAAGRQNSEYLPINARVISRAHLPTESFFPKTIPYTIAGVVVTAILSMVGILAHSLLTGAAFVTVGASPNIQPATNEQAMALMNDPQATLTADLGEDLTVSNTSHHDQTSSFDFGPTSDPYGYGNQDTPITPPAMDMSAILMSEQTKNPNQTAQTAVQNHDNVSITLAADGLLGLGKSRIVVISPPEINNQPDKGAGSVTVWVLSRLLADKGKTVAVMDMTGSGATTMQMLGDARLPGIRDVLAGEADINNIIKQDIRSSVTVLPAGNAQPRDHLSAMDRLSVIIDALSSSYDYLIIDCGIVDIESVSTVADANTVMLITVLNQNAKTSAIAIEQELASRGYEEAICIYPSAEEMQISPFLAA